MSSTRQLLVEAAGSYVRKVAPPQLAPGEVHVPRDWERKRPVA